MKTKSFIILLFSSLTYSSFAQYVENKNEYKENKNDYKWSVSAAINSVEAQMDQKLFDTWVFPSANYYGYFGNKHDKSFSLSIIPKYQVSDDIFLRFEFGITNINLQSHYNGIGDTITNKQGQIASTANITKNDTIQQKIYRYAAGIQWDFLKKKFIGIYCGASLQYLNYSKMYWSDYITNNATNQQGNYAAYTAGGFATGVGAFSGINIHLPRNISLGGEFSYSLLYYRIGGIQNGLYKRITNNVMDVNEKWTIVNNTSSGIQFSKVMPSLNITVRF